MDHAAVATRRGPVQVVDVIDAADEAGSPAGTDGRRPDGLPGAETGPTMPSAAEANGQPEGEGGRDAGPARSDGSKRAGCTSAQMRRFIKSRPYIPLHELRRRFQIEGGDDEVHGFEADGRTVFVGLPERESGMLGELVRQGEVGYELLLDPTSPIVVGVFPMRPVPHN